jgi:capsular exopolysaccharide synthesis family protein
MALALDGKRVIIVDADLRRPQQHKIFKVEKKPGLTDLLLGSATIADVLKETPLSPIRIIPAGSTPPNPAELLGSDRMQQVINALQELADIVLYDAPPTLAVADATLLASKVDGILFVVGAGETRRSNAKQAMDMLRQARINVLGTVVNKAPTGQRGYGYGYGYGYSYGYGYGYYAYSQPYAPQVGESAATATIEAAESTLPNWQAATDERCSRRPAHAGDRWVYGGGCPFDERDNHG